MPAPEPLTVLLVSDQAEDIKLMTIGLRGFYPGCRVEAVYSTKEATEWTSKDEWHVILVDEQLPPEGCIEVLPELRRRAATAAIIVLSDRSDLSASSQVLRAGADGCLFKKSSGFLAELVVVIREMLEKRDLRTRMDLTQSRYLRLVEVVPDLVYELDKEGRVSFVSQNVLPLLGYSPEELLGTHYSMLVHPADRHKAEGVMNERRTGARATKRTPVRLSPKTKTLEGREVIDVEIDAKGLYDQRNQFVGTIGLVRELTSRREDTERMQHLEARAQQADHLLELRHLTAKIAEELSTPLTGLLDDTARLVKKIEELRLEDHVQHILSQILRAARLGKELTASTLAHKLLTLPVSINELLDEALSIKASDLEKQSISVERQLEIALPVVRGDAAQLRHLFVILLSKAEQALRESATKKRLLISAQRVAGEAGLTDAVRIQISDGGWAVRMAERGSASYETEDEEWGQAAGIVKEHNGVMEVAPSSAGGLFIQTWLPTAGEDLRAQPPSPTSIAEPGKIPAPPEAPTAQPPEPRQVLKPTGEIPLAERRHSPRSAVQLDARLTHEGTTWTGQVRNIGRTGLSMEIEGFIPATVTQSIQLGLVTAAGVLQFQGKVRGIREVDRRRRGAKFFPATGLSVEFVDLNHDERLVLASLLESIRDNSVPVSLTALLQPAKPGDLLVEVRSQAGGEMQRIPLQSFPPESEELPVAEHRFATRANYGMPIFVETHASAGELQRYRGSTLNVSRCGACLRLHAPPDLVGLRSDLVLALPEAQGDQRSRADAAAAEFRIRVEVVWTLPDHSRARELRGSSSIETIRLGVRFLHLDEEGEKRVAHLVARLLNEPLRLEDFQPGSELVSTFMECRNQRGHRLAVYYDRPRKPLPPGSPMVIISPGFGETKREYIALAYALALNGFHVLRYDHTNHVGESQGEMIETTLTSMKEDLVALRRFAEHTWPASPIVLVAADLAARLALRAVVEQAGVNLLVLLTCVVDLGSTLQAVHGQDVVTAYCNGTLRDTTNVLGWNINASRWLEDMVREGYADLDMTMKDAERLRTPTIVFAAERDPTVSHSSVRELQAALGTSSKHTYVWPDFDRLHEDPGKDRTLYRQLIAACLEQCYPMAVREHIRDPSLREVSRQKLLEWERLVGRHGASTPKRVEICSEDLAPLQFPSGLPDYWLFLEDSYRLMGRPEPGQRVLDAACGNGQFGAVFMINQAYHQLHTQTKENRSPCYVGIDSAVNTISRAKDNLARIADTLQSPPSGTVPEVPIRALFSISELHRPLPFHDSSFDHVVCSLAIGYLPDPLSSIRELTRCLKAHGKLVVTNFKPYGDLTQLYRNLLVERSKSQIPDRACRLLHNVGEILEKERDGRLRCFNRQELLSLLISGGAIRPRIYATLANQAFAAVAEKPA